MLHDFSGRYREVLKLKMPFRRMVWASRMRSHVENFARVRRAQKTAEILIPKRIGRNAFEPPRVLRGGLLSPLKGVMNRLRVTIRAMRGHALY